MAIEQRILVLIEPVKITVFTQNKVLITKSCIVNRIPSTNSIISLF